MKRFRLLLSSIVIFCLITVQGIGQSAAPNWMLQDFEQDGVYGMSVEKAYPLLKSRKSKKVIVAVIDSGVDVDHEDLKDVIWKNSGEIAGNGIDDDKNGYIDDIYGWNFIGGKDGQNVHHDTYEMTRLYVMYKKKFEGSNGSGLKGTEKQQWEEYIRIKREIEQKIREFAEEQETYQQLMDQITQSLNEVKTRFNLEEVTMENLETIEISEEDPLFTSLFILKLMFMLAGDSEKAIMDGLQEGLDYFSNALNYGYNTEFDPRHIVGDNYFDSNEKNYGNNDVKGPDPSHGTHVAGIIAGKRGNGIGMDGIADNVEIMVIRVVPDGDERDKDVANGIRYAVDNGAQIINMSFGKAYVYDKQVVDDAIKYAEKKGVLLVHAAGNDGKNLDFNQNYPTRKLNKGIAKNWIEVGAMGWEMAPNSVGSFSNYGKKSVDIFAPGVDIYSTFPGDDYQYQNGTSMAAPSVSGVAAVLMSYFPDLDAVKVKSIITKTAARYPSLEVTQPGSESSNVKFSDLSVTGGVINLHNAVIEAMKVSKSK